MFACPRLSPKDMKSPNFFPRRMMAFATSFFVVLISTTILCAQAEQQRWAEYARNVTITRDDWGVAHVHGKTDADAVFGMIYAQAEDDFNRVETNYLASMGRL